MQTNPENTDNLLERCAERLRRNGFEVVILPDEKAAGAFIRERIETLAPASVSFGDSMTLYAKWTPQETVTPTATATVTPTVTATTTQTAEPTGDTSPAPTSQPDNEGSNGDTANGETTATSGISLPYLIGGILILLLAILLLLFLLLRHTVTFLIPAGGELEEYRIKVWHGRYINTEDLPALIRTAAWYRDPARQERWDFDQDRVTKSIELYLG